MADSHLLHSFVLLSHEGTRLLLIFHPSLFSNRMGTALSFFRAGTGTAMTTRETGGAEDVTRTGGLTETGGITAQSKDLVTQTGPRGDATTDDEMELPAEFLDQCGIDADWDSLQEYVPPPRIKESRLTDAERTKFKGHLDHIFEEKTIMGKRIVYDPDDVMEVMIKVQEYLKSEQMLIENLPVGITVVGDLHGQLYDLQRVFEGDEKDGKPGWECMKYLFLGNYVDRGRQSIEIVMALFCLKMLYPDRIFLLRGNHEFLETNKECFLFDFVDRYETDTAVLLFSAANEAFCYLSVAAIIDNAYLCVHAGISPAGFTRKQMRGLTKPFINSTDDLLVHNMMWSDPAQGLIGHSFNTDRSTSIFYGLDTFYHACAGMEVDIMIRGHTKLNNGYEVVWKCLFSIFTATGVDGHNDGAVAVIDDKGKISIRVLVVDKDRRSLEKKLRGDEDVTVMDKCDGNKTGAITKM